MTGNRPEFVQHLSMLDTVIAGITDAGLKETVALLKIARLDLVMRTHDITEYELAFAVEAAQKTLARKHASGRTSKTQSRKVRATGHREALIDTSAKQ